MFLMKNSRSFTFTGGFLFPLHDGDSSNLALTITGQFSLKIVETSEEFVDKFPEVFELGLPEYSYSVDVFSDMNLEGTLKSQATAVVQDSNWI